jgi:hypothetical protein
MKTTFFKLWALLFGLSSIMVSCSNDNDNPINDPIPTVIQADNEWHTDSLVKGEIKWYKVTGDPTFITMVVEWSEADYHGTSKTFTADIKVSAYQLDGVTPYFENKDNGYGENAKSIELSAEKEVLLKVVLNDEVRPGTFALKTTGTTANEVTYETLTISDTWTEATISEGQTKGFQVDCTGKTQVYIIWAEAGSPETGYTADVMGSVFKSDGTNLYKIVENGKDFLNKSNSGSDNPKAIAVDATNKIVKIQIAKETAVGTFAIKVVEVAK